MPEISPYTRRAIEYIRYLSEEIGGRGSCTSKVRQALDYIANHLQASGVKQVNFELFTGTTSTYRPYALAFGSALLGTVVFWLIGGQRILIAVAILSGLAAWGMIAETDFTPNWLRWMLPTAKTHNLVGILLPTGEIQHRAVLCAHVDTHRTPVIYSSSTWHRLFSLLVTLAFASLTVNILAYGLSALFYWQGVRWLGLVTGLVQLLALMLCLQAEFTPFSPGANDNASGVGTVLGLVQRLTEEPLQNTELWVLFTDCEEVGAYGIGAFMDLHAEALGAETLYIVLDEVGIGGVEYLIRDGLILKRNTHPRAIVIARQATAALPNLAIAEQVGMAYTDGTAVTRRGLPALHINTIDRSSSPQHHWHQMSDRLETLDLQALENTHRFAWQVLQVVDAG